jgi:RNA polymerase sigma-70 factor (ECF subfamily)
MAAAAISPVFPIHSVSEGGGQEAWKRLSDEEMIRNWRAGWAPMTREELSDELFARHQARITRWCSRFTRDRETALDLTQETLIRAYRNLDSYRGECRFSTWLYVIARNQCMTALQKRASEPAWVGKSCAMDLADSSDIFADFEMAQNRSRKWNLILATLDRKEAKVMMMHYGQEMPLDAVSRSLGLTNKSGAKAYIVSARRKLAAKLTSFAESAA